MFRLLHAKVKLSCRAPRMRRFAMLPGVCSPWQFCYPA